MGYSRPSLFRGLSFGVPIGLALWFLIILAVKACS